MSHIVRQGILSKIELVVYSITKVNAFIKTNKFIFLDFNQQITNKTKEVVCIFKKLQTLIFKVFSICKIRI